MSSDTNNTIVKNRSQLNLKQFLLCLDEKQKRSIAPLIAASARPLLRKSVYLSSGGKYLKYAEHLKLFVYQNDYVPVHPVVSLNYYLSSITHNQSKSQIMRDCFTLLTACDELWVFEDRLPAFNHQDEIIGNKPLNRFPEGVLAEIYFWLANKPNSPLRFFTWKDIGIAKYAHSESWSLVPQAAVEEGRGEIGGQIKQFGIIDMGSSTIKLSVCRRNLNSEVETLHKKAITVNLAEGFFETRELQAAAIARTIQATNDCQKEALNYGVVDICLVGTGILRKATNISRFAEEVKEKTNLDLKVISSQEEAELVYRAVDRSFTNNHPDLIVMNAGGGTTEIVFGGIKSLKQFSIPLGITDLNEKFLGHYPLSEAGYAQMRLYIKEILKKHLPHPPEVSDSYLVYTGGELDYMIITGFPLKDSGLSLAHPKKIQLAYFKQKAGEMRRLTLDELHAYMPVNPAWMNGAIASNTLLEASAEFLGVQTIIPSNKNLNDGLLFSVFR